MALLGCLASPAGAGPVLTQLPNQLPNWAPDQACAPATVATLLSAHIRALGGQAALDGVRGLIIRGRYSEGHAAFDAVQAKMRPYYRLVGDPGKPPGAFAEGYDGSAWEYYGKMGIVLRTVGAAAAASRHGLAMFGPLAAARDDGSNISCEGKDSVAGRPAWRLRVHMADGYEEDELLDARTHLIVATRKVAKIHAFGAKVASETRYSDFRTVAGVRFAFKAQKVEIATGRVLNSFTTTAIEINPALSPADFSPPQFRRTPLAGLLERLYAERTDAQAALWSYRAFASDHRDLDMDFAMQVIGYQILKTGVTRTAIALLAANAQAYPTSSGAHFGLGRAYNSAGDTARAKAAFKAALALDPANKRAAIALKALGATPKP